MYYKLQALRGLAACILVFYKSPFNVFEQKLSFMLNSYLFVDLFFVLSGFVLSHAYAKAIVDGLSFKRYMLLRVARVYPLHFFMLFAFVGYELLRLTVLSGDANEARTLATFASNLFLVHSLGFHDLLTWNTPSWSISVEFYCYIVFFFLLRSFDSRKSLWVPLLVSVICYVAIVALGKKTLNVTYDWGIVRCIGGFYLGVFIYRVIDVARLNWMNKHVSWLEWVVLIMLVFAVTTANQGWVFQWLAIVSFGLSIAVFSCSSSGLMGRLFLTKPIQLLGEWSYSIYMVHMLVWTLVNVVTLKILKLDALAMGGAPVLLINVGVFILTVVASAVTYRWVEDKPRRWVKQKLQRVVQ